MKKTKEELLEEQNELLRELVAGVKEITEGKVEPFP